MPEDVDPRYTLANERTYLAWIRTALGMLAAAAGLVAVDLPWPAVAVRALAIVLATAAGASAFLAWDRWRKVEAALAAGTPAPPPRAHIALTLAVGAVSAIVVILILF
ncbi:MULTISPECIES: YidH family protein [Nocardioides]|uniref:YidH family protein n=1 Tax=Nocardioides vastitatis TaxID=2568655 RepID=A0ABW0ZI24_9ACTN|nr:DUF202 domain-containing protein [Nocardioides sp.]THJ00706.1 DUF202 domain-containing protein [Nocardioides sp.]